MSRRSFDRRLAPRPLGYHLMLGASTWMGGAAALPAVLGGLPVIHDSLVGETDALRAQAMRTNGFLFAGAVLTAAEARVRALTAGIEAYHRHPARRQEPVRRAVARFGSTRLVSFGGRKPAAGLLAVPSLINPAYILDLAPGNSLMSYLKTCGLRPYLVDWGTPGAKERGFTLSDYILHRLEPALDAAVARTGGPVHLVGYCMGGNLALALALRRPEAIRSLALLATPWDFHAASVTLIRALSTMLVGTLIQLPRNRPIPVDLLQLFFASLDPTLSDRKFRHFGRLDPASPEAHAFVAIEDWVNDGMPLPYAVAEDCLYGWYGQNSPAAGRWMVAGAAVDPGRIACPTLVVVPRADRIVPPESALALAARIPGAETFRAAAGHVAMVAGPGAEAGLWRPLAEWINTH